ncbi:MAG: universal stress protein [Salinivirgaceae bacterium]|nr:universal stress protein [Salinivirgaceae bacterium]
MKSKVQMSERRNHILVPINFSQCSENALKHAIVYANALNCDVKMIYVKRNNADYDYSVSREDFDEVVKSRVIEDFKQLISTYQSRLNGSFEYCFREGSVYAEVCNQALYGDAEMIVVGTNGVDGFKEKWFGSNAFRIVSYADCPTISINQSFGLKEVKRILLPIDLSAKSRNKVSMVVNLAKKFNAQVVVAAMCTSKRESALRQLDKSLKEVSSFLDRHNVDYLHERIHTTKRKMAQTIEQFAETHDIDLMAVVVDKTTSSWQELFGNAVPQMLVNHSKIPVISVKI